MFRADGACQNTQRPGGALVAKVATLTYWAILQMSQVLVRRGTIGCRMDIHVRHMTMKHGRSEGYCDFAAVR